MTCLVLAGCGVAVSPDTVPPGNPGFVGVIASDEPRATQVGRDLMRAGGNAADAAGAIGLALAVTLPSRAGLNAGGMCAVFDGRGTGKLLVFDPRRQGTGAGLARGLAALRTRFGRLPWPALVAPAEALARFGFPVSNLLAADLARHGDALLKDPAALAVFVDPRRTYLAAGSALRLPRLADALARLRANLAIAPAGSIPAWRDEPLRKIGDVDMLAPADRAAASSPPATGFVVGDREGGAVSCVIGLGAVFGAGTLDEDGVLRAGPADIEGFPALWFDMTSQHVVLMTAAYGPDAAMRSTVLSRRWLVAGDDYTEVRRTLNDASRGGEKTGMTAALCPEGLALAGRGCRTLIDGTDHGLGLTFGPEITQ